MTLEIIITIAGAFGGLELIKWLYRVITNRGNDKRINEAEADLSEFHTLKEINTFLQEQLDNNEKRFADQTVRLRSAQDERDKVVAENAELRLKNANAEFHRCNIKRCIEREPPNEYL